MPAEGVTQLAGKVLRQNIDRPDWVNAPLPAQEGSPRWWGQQLGGGIGLLVPYLASRFVLRKASTFVAGNTAQSALELELAKVKPSSLKTTLFESCGAGLMVGGVFAPSRQQDTFWTERGINALSTGFAFTTMAGVNRLLPGRLSSPVLPSRILRGTLSGLAGGVVDVESRSLLSGQGLASGPRLREVLPAYAACGGVLSLLPSTLPWRPGKGLGPRQVLPGNAEPGSGIKGTVERDGSTASISMSEGWSGSGQRASLPSQIKPLGKAGDSATTAETTAESEPFASLSEAPAGRRIKVTNGYFDIQPDGSVYENYDNGNRILHRPDGSIVEYDSLGARTLRLPDGSSVRQQPGGEVTETHPGLLSLTKKLDGSTEITFADGHRYVNRAGKVEHIKPDGKQETFVVRGVRLINKHGGEATIVNGEGKTICRVEESDIVTPYKDGSFRVEHFDGGVTEINADGGWVKYDLYSGQREIGFPDGSRIIQGSEGSSGNPADFD